MRARLAPIFGLLTLAGCSDGEPTYQILSSTNDGPPAALVLRIDKMLSGDPCLKRIASMRREYRFSSRNGGVVRNLVAIEVTKAGHDGMPAGIFILPMDHSLEFDDREYFLGLATYAVREKVLDLWACGSNTAGGLRHEPRF